MEWIGSYSLWQTTILFWVYTYTSSYLTIYRNKRWAPALWVVMAYLLTMSQFGIEDLKTLPNQTGCWDGVRNYQARNFMRDMKEGQHAFFYHSNCKEPGIAGVMKVSLYLFLFLLVVFQVWCLSPAFSFPDCKGVLCGPHSVWQERCPLRRHQQGRQPQMEYGMNGFMFTFVCVPDGLRSRYITDMQQAFYRNSI